MAEALKASRVNAPAEPFRPSLTAAARPATYVVPAIDEHGTVRETPIAGEHPLTLYVDKREIVTLMTLGAAPEALAIGYLRNQRLLSSIQDIVAVQVDWEVNAVAVTTRNGLVDLDEKLSKFVTREAARGLCRLPPAHARRRASPKHRPRADGRSKSKPCGAP